jgi:Domain of unknown function (DUF4160)
MTTIHRERGFAFRIHKADHPPPHVHVWKAGAVMKVRLGDSAASAWVEDAGEMRSPDVVRAVRIVEANWAAFLEKWKEIHGHATADRRSDPGAD